MALEITTDFTDEQIEAVSRPDLGEDLNFSKAATTIRVIRDIANAIRGEDPEQLPDNLLGEVETHRGQLVQIANEIVEFKVAQANPVDARDQIIRRINQERQWFATEVRPHIRGTDVSLSDAQAVLSRATDAASEIEGILSDIRSQAGEAAATELSGYYTKQTERYHDVARSWLIGGALVIVATAILGLDLFVWQPLPIVTAAAGDVRWEEFARGLVERLFFLGLAAYALAFVTRNYRVAKHLEVVNEQKRNALNTYTLFVAAVSDAETQNLITVELVRTIFAAVETGYLSAEQATTIIENTPSLLSAARPLA
jgi:hypothetical protein